MAGNCLVFGIRIIQAAGYNPDGYDGAVRGIAVGVATLACLVHTFSRRGGIWLGNLFALIKVLLLTLMVIVGICAWGGAFKTENYVSENLAVQNAFAKPATEPFGYVNAFLSVIFAWTGFDQPTYVRRKVPVILGGADSDRSSVKSLLLGRSFLEARVSVSLSWSSYICWSIWLM